MSATGKQEPLKKTPSLFDVKLLRRIVWSAVVGVIEWKVTGISPGGGKLVL
ncbi:MAG: hypothetical protein ACJ749_19780 [Flavisolibacter sp.]